MFRLHICAFTACTSGAHRGQKRTLCPPELELRSF